MELTEIVTHEAELYEYRKEIAVHAVIFRYNVAELVDICREELRQLFLHVNHCTKNGLDLTNPSEFLHCPLPDGLNGVELTHPDGTTDWECGTEYDGSIETLASGFSEEKGEAVKITSIRYASYGHMDDIGFRYNAENARWELDLYGFFSIFNEWRNTDHPSWNSFEYGKIEVGFSHENQYLSVIHAELMKAMD